MKIDELIAQIQAYRAETSEGTVQALCEDYLRSRAGAKPDEHHIEAILDALKGGRHFAALAAFADQALVAGIDTPAIYSFYAQGLIDQGYLDAAIGLLSSHMDAAESESDRSEFLGLLGRAHKQRFVNACELGHKEPAHILQAVHYYSEGYKIDPVWHGPNLVALAYRAAVEGIGTPYESDIAGFAQRVVDSIRAAGKPDDYWTIASIAEASLALKDWPTVSKYYTAFARHPEVHKFGINSAIRQLREIWGGVPGGTDLISDILRILQVYALSSPAGGGALRFTAHDSQQLRAALENQNDDRLEAILGANGLVAKRDLERLFDRSRAVCRVINRHSCPEKSVGTGFIVHGRDLLEDMDTADAEDWDHPLLITNSHVLSEDGFQGSVKRIHARAMFDELGACADVEKLLWESPRDELDVVIAKLGPGSRGNPFPTLRLNDDQPPLADCATAPSGEKVYIIGHPNGRGLSFSLSDNLVIDHDFVTPTDPPGSFHRIHYAAPTEPGNSGSPVFDTNRIDVIGIHRIGNARPMRRRTDDKPYRANEAVAIDSVRKRLANRTHR